MRFEEIAALLFSNQDATELLRHELESLEREKVRIAVIGRSGTGKSSLINALCGSKVARTGVTETTDEPREYEWGGLHIIDCPGCGTRRFPMATYVDDLKLNSYDAFLLVTAKRVFEDDIILMNEISQKIGRTVHVIRSMIDQDLENAHEDGLSPSEALLSMRDDLIAQCTQAPVTGNRSTDAKSDISQFKPRGYPLAARPKFWLVSARHSESFDFPALQDTIYQDLPEAKREKFAFSVHAYTSVLLHKKRDVARKQVLLFAGLAAANGFNPLFGLDIAADIAIISQMNSWILRCYKLDDKSTSHYRNVTGAKAHKVQAILGRVAAYGAREFIVGTLKKQAGRITSKEIAKWFPIVGSVTAAGTAFAMVNWMGNDLIKKCEDAVQELVQENI